MKTLRILPLLLAAILLFTLAACSENEQTATDPPVAKTPGASDTANTPDDTSVPPSAGFSADDLKLIIDGDTYVCDVKVDDTLEAFGDDYRYAETISCAYDGMDKSYAYADVEITTYPQGEDDYILDILVYGGDVKTTKGITIGASEADVVAAYGDGYEMEGILMRYVIPSGSDKIAGAALEFTMEDGVVTAIGIFAEQVIAEDA